MEGEAKADRGRGEKEMEEIGDFRPNMIYNLCQIFDAIFPPFLCSLQILPDWIGWL